MPPLTTGLPFAVSDVGKAHSGDPSDARTAAISGGVSDVM
jgi:hypothetical protein